MDKLRFPKGTVSKNELKMIRVEPNAKEVIDKLVAETGLTNYKPIEIRSKK